MDLDRFKEVNDALGHSAGDELLRQVGQRLAAQLRHGDLLVRLGGDEFAMLMPGATQGEALALASRLRTALQAAFTHDDMRVFIDASVGIACAPEAAGDVEGLLQRADIAMYQAKSDGLGALVYASAEDDLTQRLRGIEQLRDALDNGELLLHYQAKVDLRTGSLTGVEALVRWQHPQLGLLMPGSFIPEAERCGLMRRLTATVLTLALDQVRQWTSEGGPSHVAVNVSASNLLDTELPRQIADMLRIRGLPGHVLTAEITEDVLMVDPTRALRVLTELRALGVHISVDDYGTGHSSLARLRDLPVTELKLDRSFVQDIDTDSRAAAIVASTVQLAHSLGLRLVAEGVESEQVTAQLRELGCDIAQGYHLGRPLPAAAFTGQVRVPAPSRSADDVEGAARQP
jgi:diguanylate cyclase (GGDEF)-like protein